MLEKIKRNRHVRLVIMHEKLLQFLKVFAQVVSTSMVFEEFLEPPFYVDNNDILKPLIDDTLNTNISLGLLE